MSAPEPRVEPDTGRLACKKDAASGRAPSLPAFRQPLHSITKKMPPSAKNRFGRKVPSRYAAGRNEPVAQCGLFLQPADMPKNLVRCRCPQKIPPWFSILCVGGIHPSNKGNPRQPRIVKFCCGLVKIRRASEPAHRSHAVGLAIIVPAIRAADNKVDAQFVLEPPLPPFVRYFTRKIRTIAKETDVFKPAGSRRVARNQVGMRPERNESSIPQPPCVSRVLDDVQLRARVSEIIRHDPDKENAIRRSKVALHAAGEGHQHAIRWHRMSETRRKAASFEGKPSLENPALRTCNLAAFLKPGDFSGPPGFLPVRIRKIPLRKIKMNLHEHLDGK